jgi:hypothetical protein
MIPMAITVQCAKPLLLVNRPNCRVPPSTEYKARCITLSSNGKEKENEDKSESDNELNRNRTVAHPMAGAQEIR